MNKSQIMRWVLSQEWAMRINALEAIQAFAEGDIEIKDMDKSTFHAAFDKQTYSTFLPQDGTQLEGSSSGMVYGSTAVIPLCGPIFPRANMMTEWSGATDLNTFINDVKAAVENPYITSIILNVDSPGGEITGVAEAANYIFNAKNIKPISAYVFGQCASAAYWIASACTEMVMFTTGMVGSIGVVCGFADRKALDEKNGVRKTEIVSSQSPLKRVDVFTDDGKAHVQKSVDTLADVFINAVATHRGVAVDTVLSNFGQGGMLVGQLAVDAGMADRIAPLSSMLADCQKKQFSSYSNFTGGNNMDPKELMAKFPETYSAILAEGKAIGMTEGIASGKATENARIAAIEGIKVAGFETIIAANKFNMDLDKNSISALIVEEQGKREQAKSSAILDDGKSAAEQASGINAGANDSATVAAAEDALMKSMREGASK